MAGRDLTSDGSPKEVTALEETFKSYMAAVVLLVLHPIHRYRLTRELTALLCLYLLLLNAFVALHSSQSSGSMVLLLYY